MRTLEHRCQAARPGGSKSCREVEKKAFKARGKRVIRTDGQTGSGRAGGRRDTGSLIQSCRHTQLTLPPSLQQIPGPQTILNISSRKWCSGDTHMVQVPVLLAWFHHCAQIHSPPSGSLALCSAPQPPSVVCPALPFPSPTW